MIEMSKTIEISFYELFAFLGLVQSVFILVYIASRSWWSSRSIIPFLYFLMLGGLFFAELSTGLIPFDFPQMNIWLQLAWMLLPVLSYLFITQIIHLEKLPSAVHYMVLPPVFILFAFVREWFGLSNECGAGLSMLTCKLFTDSLMVVMIIFASIVVTILFLDPDGLRSIRQDKGKKERYWLCLTLILVNIGVIAIALAVEANLIVPSDARAVRLILGAAYAYLATTTLFRIYPPSLPTEKVANPDALNSDERVIAAQIDKLMTMDKLYQEPNFSRADLARELDISEGVITKLINTYYGVSFPVLINKSRVEEAKHLLLDTDMSVKDIAAEVGFSSIATFNRVFKELTEQTASTFRAANEKA